MNQHIQNKELWPLLEIQVLSVTLRIYGYEGARSVGTNLNVIADLPHTYKVTDSYLITGVKRNVCKAHINDISFFSHVIE